MIMILYLALSLTTPLATRCASTAGNSLISVDSSKDWSTTKARPSNMHSVRNVPSDTLKKNDERQWKRIQMDGRADCLWPNRHAHRKWGVWLCPCFWDCLCFWYLSSITKASDTSILSEFWICIRISTLRNQNWQNAIIVSIKKTSKTCWGEHKDELVNNKIANSFLSHPFSDIAWHLSQNKRWTIAIVARHYRNCCETPSQLLVGTIAMVLQLDRTCSHQPSTTKGHHLPCYDERNHLYIKCPL